jgi:hypothetical protein
MSADEHAAIATSVHVAEPPSDAANAPITQSPPAATRNVRLQNTVINYLGRRAAMTLFPPTDFRQRERRLPDCTRSQLAPLCNSGHSRVPMLRAGMR